LPTSPRTSATPSLLIRSLVLYPLSYGRGEGSE
jgi:hypothetical protein